MDRTRNLLYISIGAALISVSAWLTVPGPIPFTMQSFAVLTVAALLGAKNSVLCAAVYLLLGAVGVPVFSGLRGGASVLIGPTGGYLVGFLFTSAVTGYLSERKCPLALAMAAGQLTLYVIGTLWFAVLYGESPGAVLSTCVLPFLLPDAVKALLAVQVVRRVKKSGILH